MRTLKTIAVTIAHNEEDYIASTIESVLNQDIDIYVVVDDDSEDNTAEIIKQYPVVYVKVNQPRYRLGTYNMRRAFMLGIDKATELCPDWKFLLKVDADVTIPTRYLLGLLSSIYNIYNIYNIYDKETLRDIGICSGIPQGGHVWKGRSYNGASLYTRDCWDAIRGFDHIIHWDTHAIVKAYQNGFNVTAFSDIEVVEQRTSERESLYEWYLTGCTRYYLGFPLYHTIGVGVLHSRKYPYLIGSAVMILSQLLNILMRKEKPFEKSYYDFTKSYAWWETKLRLRR